eukprot:2997952-Rhodomonas_salina.1
MSSLREAFWRSEPDKCCRKCGEHNPKSWLTHCHLPDNQLISKGVTVSVLVPASNAASATHK